MASVELEIGIDGKDPRSVVKFGHADEAGVGERHGDVGVFAHEDGDGVARRHAEGLEVARDVFDMMMARENASQRREWMETYGNLVDADIS